MDFLSVALLWKLNQPLLKMLGHIAVILIEVLCFVDKEAHCCFTYLIEGDDSEIVRMDFLSVALLWKLNQPLLKMLDKEAHCCFTHLIEGDDTEEPLGIPHTRINRNLKSDHPFGVIIA
nr:hypothetical protein [Tanacetum cinerariifolium]